MVDNGPVPEAEQHSSGSESAETVDAAVMDGRDIEFDALWAQAVPVEDTLERLRRRIHGAD